LSSLIGPYIFLNILLSNIRSMFSSFIVRGQLLTAVGYNKTMFFIPSTYNSCIIETCLLSLHVSARSSHHQVPEF
jgi:hypothetical protein